MAVIRPPITGDPALDSFLDQVTNELDAQGVAQQAIVTTVVESSGGQGITTYTDTLEMWRRTDSDTAPDGISSTVVYSYTAGTLSVGGNDTDVVDGWHFRNFPPLEGGDYLWRIFVHISDTSTTETIPSDAWSAPAVFAETLPGQRNGRGQIYIAASSTPATPSGGSIDWDTGIYTPPTGWSNEPPEASEFGADTEIYTSYWVALEAADLNSTAFSYTGPIISALVVGDLVSRNYDGDRDSESYGDDNSGTSGYFLDASTGHAVFNGVTVRGNSTVDNTTIGGVADINCPVVGDRNLVIASIGGDYDDKGATKANLRSWGTRNYNTYLTFGLTATANGTYSVSGTSFYLKGNDSNGNAWPGWNSSDPPSLPYQGALMEVQQGSTDRGWFLPPFFFSSPIIGYDGFVLASYRRQDSSSLVANGGNLTIDIYGGWYSFSDWQEITEWRSIAGGTLQFADSDRQLIFDLFTGYGSGDAATPDSVVDFTATTQVRYRVEDTDGTTISTLTSSTATHTVTNGASSSNSANTLSWDNAARTLVMELDSTLGELSVEVNPNYTIKCEVKLSITSANATFPGFNAVRVDPAAEPVTITTKENSNIDVATYIAALDDEYSLEAIGGEGVFLHSDKVFEGSLTLNDTDNSQIIVQLETPGALYLAKVIWDEASPNPNNRPRQAYCLLNWQRYNVIDGASNLDSKVFNWYDTNSAVQGTPIFDRDGTIVCTLWTESRTTPLTNLRGITRGNHTNVIVTDVWDLYRHE